MHDNSLREMWLAVAFCIALVIGPASFVSANAAAWIIQPDKSDIRWAAKWNTTPLHGGFDKFTAQIIFDLDNLDDAVIAVDVDTASIYLEGQDARSTLAGETWFNTKAYPVARFASEDIRHMGNGRYEASGTLEMRGVTSPVVLPFKLTIEGDIARVEGGLTLDRTVFGLGLVGDVAAAIAPAVDVSVNVTARRQE